ncbi:hypothetical protein Deipe_2249 [Deinococcus peraridilitoris DSM 19664]|uniref:Uncharacterized protein n=1 Tax=Deinococcus peraridilitoris (strain DSM 19664 / LMG 22246 / CIP 109416 / KR-200) TaxID=937777 RepID=L0A1F9_DEIPD|nr:hypothetical protein Deipe_2249 [Deinococcus peraridilitoris DSM 19664]
MFMRACEAENGLERALCPPKRPFGLFYKYMRPARIFQYSNPLEQRLARILLHERLLTTAARPVKVVEKPKPPCLQTTGLRKGS